MTYTIGVRKRCAQIKLIKKKTCAAEVGIGAEKMRTTNYELNKSYTKQEFEELNYQPKESEVVMKLVKPEHYGINVSDYKNNGSERFVIKSKSEIEYQLMYNEFSNVISAFEKETFGQQIIEKYQCDIVYGVGNELISLAGLLVVQYLMDIEHGYGVEQTTYEDSNHNLVLVEIKKIPQDKKTLLEMYDQMVPVVSTYNQNRKQGKSQEESFEAAQETYAQLIERLELENQIKKQLSEII